MGVINVGSTLGGIAGGAATARLLVTVSGQASGLEASLAQAGGSLKGFQSNATQIGNQLIRSVTLPLLAIGGAALKMAVDYQAAMARVAGLTTATSEQVADASERILDLAKEVPTAPKELADSLYFAASAGLKFEQAMQVVEYSAKGAAIGMGEANDLSKVLIFSLNAYKGAGLTAAHAMDVFAEAVKRGTADPDEMALALGRLLPVAREAGITFETAVASIASLTNIGLPTRVAATSLRALFGGLMAPTQQATEALAEFGLTTQDLRNALEAGPLVAFKLLENATGGNADQMRKLIPQIRAMTAYLGLSGERADEAAKAFLGVRNSAGAFERAFKKIQGTEQFKFEIALNKLRVAGIELGNQLFPIFDRLIAFISTLADSFDQLGPAGHAVAAALIGIAASIGPLVKLFGVLTANGAGLLVGWKAMTTGLITMGFAALVAVNGFRDITSGTAGLAGTVLTAVTAFVAARIALQLLFKAAMAGVFGVGALSEAFVALGANAGLIGLAVAAVVITGAKIIEWARAAGNAVNHFGESLHDITPDVKISDFFVDLMKNAKTFEDVKLDTTFARIAESAGALGSTMQKGLPKIVEYLETLKASGDLPDYGEEILTMAKAQLDYFEQSTADKIALYAADSDAVNRYAQKYGVSTDYIKEKLGEVGVGATDLTKTTEKSWAEQVGLVEGASGKMQNAMDELKEKEAEAVADRQKSLSSDALGKFFDKQVETVTRSTAALLTATDTQTANLVEFAQNTQTLLKRGLNPGTLQFLVDQGPAMVGKFVDASADELKQLERNYAISLGAVDAAILNEGDHQHIKGKKIVAQFSEGILKNKHLPVAAQTEIMGRVVGAIKSGDMKEGGAEVVRQFVSGIFAEPGVTDKTATKLSLQFVRKLTEGDFKGAGNRDIAQWALGIAEESPNPIRKAQLLGRLLKSALGISTFGIGASVVENYASGMTSRIQSVEIAALKVANATAHAFHENLKNSPKYFSYYMGQELIAQMHEGMASSNFTGFRPNIIAGGGSQGLEGQIAHKEYHVHFHGDGPDRHNRRKQAREFVREVRNEEVRRSG